MISIDFNITSDVYWLRVADYSLWGVIDEQPSIINITIPGYSNPVVKYFDKHKTNGFSSIVLGINCEQECGETELVTLPDGIYTVEVVGSPSSYNKKRFYLKTDILQMDIDKMIISSIDNKRYKALEPSLIEIEMLLNGAHANLRFDRIKEASMLYKMARKAVDKVLNCKNCY